jgi:hypothetical protein
MGASDPGADDPFQSIRWRVIRTTYEESSMHLRSIRRATALALAGLLVLAGAATADSVRADGDTIEPGAQTFVDLGQVAPSAEITVAIAFTLVCGNLSHPDPGQTITLSLDSATAPLDGDIAASSSGTVGPVPIGWTADGEGCPDPLPTLDTGTTGSLTLRAPSVPGAGYVYTTLWRRALSPAGNDDGSAFNRTSTGVSFTLEVVGNTPPVLTVPADSVVEGDTTGGWTASYAVSAVDAEDPVEPAPVCVPAAGSVLPLGATTVSCTATDSGGLQDADTFQVMVVDTTAPSLAGMPTDISVTTASLSGAVVSWVAPTATDVVDGAPLTTCLPVSGSTFAVGTTTVTCTAADASGNEASAAFLVDVRYVAPVTTSATWHEPLPADGSPFVANRGRTLPVKVTLRVDSAVRTEGDAALRLDPCGGGASTTVPMAYGGGRWNASLDTSALPGACFVVSAVIDGLDAGSFQLDLRGVEAAKTKATGRPR